MVKYQVSGQFNFPSRKLAALLSGNLLDVPLVTEEAPGGGVGRLSDPPGLGSGQLQPLDLVKGVGQEGPHVVQLDQLGVVQLGVQLPGLDEGGHKGGHEGEQTSPLEKVLSYNENCPHIDDAITEAIPVH